MIGPLRLDALGTGVPFVALTGICAVTFAVLWRARPRVAIAQG